MKNLLNLFFIFLPFCVIGQTDSTQILSSELPLIIFTPKENSSQHFSVFLLSKYKSHVSSTIRCGENIAVTIPKSAQSEIYLKEIMIPVKRNDAPYRKASYDYFLMYNVKGKDTLVAIEPLKQNITSNKIELIIDKYYYLENAIPNFTFILKPHCGNSDRVITDLFKFTFRFKSRLTYEWKNDKLELVNFQNRDEKQFDLHKMLNWQVDIKYIAN